MIARALTYKGNPETILLERENSIKLQGFPLLIILVFSIAIPLAQLNNSTSESAAMGQISQRYPENFAVIALPDTQFYSESYPVIFDNQTRWIVNSATTLNTKMVTHEGDIVNNGGSIQQWQRANHSLSMLDGHVPWAVIPGNHDSLGDTNLVNYNTYFPKSRFNGQIWYGDAYNGINTNSFELFTGGQDDYLIFHFQYHPTDAILQWANTTIANYPTRRVIITTHDYLNIDGTRRSAGNHIWNNFVKHHADQIFLVLCGHMHGEAIKTDTPNGHTVYQLLADYQEGYPNGGNGWLRILDFHPAEDKIYVKTYSPYLDHYQIDNDSQFSLDYNMTSEQPATINLHLNAGWNMISFPVIPSSTSFSDIFSGVSHYQVVTWDGTNYVTPTLAEVGRGYWVLVFSDTDLNVSGTVVESYERDLPAAWSLIGSICDVSVDADTIFPDDYQLLTWDGTTYVTSTAIELGKGCWTFVLSPTHILVEPTLVFAASDSILTSPTGDFRWLDVADQAYGSNYISNYNYSQATVTMSYRIVGNKLTGRLVAENLKPNFAYQLKLVGTPNTVDNERIGFAGRWWQEVWNGSAWTGGQNLNNKGNGSSPNPNDLTYLSRRLIEDDSSPTGYHYRYTGYLPFDYFITNSTGDATLLFETGSCYHVLWKTDQRSHTTEDGPLKTVTFDPDPSQYAYDQDYLNSTISIFGEWERLPIGEVNLMSGQYDCSIVLTEESFHGTGPLHGNWASAMNAQITFTITQ